MPTILRRIFSVNFMVKKEHVKGELPKSKEAYKDLLNIAIPSIIEMVFMSLIGSVDVVMVGRLGYEAIAAVGLAGQPRMIMMSLFIALNAGVTAIVARRKGEDKPEDARRTLRNSLVVIFGLSLVVMTVAIIFSRQIMIIAGAQEDTIDMATDYFRIMIYFFPVNTLTMCINAAQRGIGNTKVTMTANLMANVVNVIFDTLLIYGNLGFPRLGVAGDAWASGMGFVVGMLISYGRIFNKTEGKFLYLSFKDSWKLDKETVSSVFKIGGNSMLEQVAQRIGMFIYAITIANLGTVVYAAHQVAMQFLGFSFNFGNGLAIAGTSLVGQMLGKERPDLAVVYGKCAQRLAFAASFLIAGSIIAFRAPLVSIFLSRGDPANAESFAIATTLMIMVALFQPPQTSSVVVSGCLRGAGDNLYVAIIMIITVAIMRPVLSLAAVHLFGFGIIGAWSASLIDMSTRFILAYKRFSGSKWHNIKV